MSTGEYAGGGGNDVPTYPPLVVTAGSSESPEGGGDTLESGPSSTMIMMNVDGYEANVEVVENSV